MAVLSVLGSGCPPTGTTPAQYQSEQLRAEQQRQADERHADELRCRKLNGDGPDCDRFGTALKGQSGLPKPPPPPPEPDHSQEPEPTATDAPADTWKPGAETPDADADVTIENGVAVAFSNARFFCFPVGSLRVCEATAKLCRARASQTQGAGVCSASDAMACLSGTVTLSGEERAACFGNMTMCKAAEAAILRSPDWRDVQPCIVMRYRPKK